jgi:hypothetical protein
MSNDDNYKVGYGKPPKHTQFKKGQSGWTKGRRKKERKPPDIETGLINALSATVNVTENGVRRRITKFEAACTQMANKAASGDAATIRLLLPLFTRMAEQIVRNAGRDTAVDDNTGYDKLCEMLGLPPEPKEKNHPDTTT